jgi:hypothetical protein
MSAGEHGEHPVRLDGERIINKRRTVSPLEGGGMRYPLRRIAAAGVALGIVLYYGDLLFRILGGRVGGAPAPYVGGLLALVLVYSVYVALSGDHRIWNVAKGQDGRASTSKFQVLLWFGVVLFAYVATVTARIQAGETEPLPGIPTNVLIVLGISVGTLTGAAAVTSGQVSAQRDVKVPADNLGLAPLVQGDDGRPDIGKIQLLGWTVVAIGVFLAQLAYSMPVPDSLPDIDASLLVLTGPGTATYLGGKLITTATPAIHGILPNPAKAGEQVTITGANLGSAGYVELGGTQLAGASTSWTDTQVVFTIPTKKPGTNQDWVYGLATDVRVHGTNGRSVNVWPLTITQP